MSKITSEVGVMRVTARWWRAIGVLTVLVFIGAACSSGEANDSVAVSGELPQSEEASAEPAQPEPTVDGAAPASSEATHDDDEATHDDDEATHDDDEATHDDDEATHADDEATDDEDEGNHEDDEGTHDDDEGTHDDDEGTHDDGPAPAADFVLDVTMVDFGYESPPLTVPIGSTVTFRFANTGAIEHEAIIAPEHVQLEQAEATERGEADGDHGHHGDVPQIVLGSGEAGELTVTFDEIGEVIIGCHIPGHWDAGMRAVIDVV